MKKPSLIELEWQRIGLSWISDKERKEIALEWGSRRLRSQFYRCDLSQISEKPGVYFFAQKNIKSKKYKPVYIGESLNLMKRINQDLADKAIMDHLRDNTKRSGFEPHLFIGRLLRKHSKGVTRMIQRALIDQAIQEKNIQYAMKLIPL
ncbi:MAG: hypothetical protein HZB44_03465 [Actinobacteria bacterium]|nr:hypothetical protein [Actinomycetota bacterium]